MHLRRLFRNKGYFLQFLSDYAPHFLGGERSSAYSVKCLADSGNNEFVDRTVLFFVKGLQPLNDFPLAFICKVKTDIQPVIRSIHPFASAFICASARYSYPFAAAQMSSTNFTRSVLNL